MPGPRVAAHCLIRRDAEVLLIRIQDGVTGEVGWRAPGGGIEFGETAETAIRREIQEELGEKLGDVRQLGVLEGFITWKGEDLHEIVFVFEGTIVDAAFLSRPKPPGVEESGRVLDLHWVVPEQLAERGERFYPEGLPALLALAGSC
jgi:8-oxo-dGTP pyrophosphatase MutT (NUDIX family)